MESHGNALIKSNYTLLFHGISPKLFILQFKLKPQWEVSVFKSLLIDYNNVTISKSYFDFLKEFFCQKMTVFYNS